MNKYKSKISIVLISLCLIVLFVFTLIKEQENRDYVKKIIRQDNTQKENYFNNLTGVSISFSYDNDTGFTRTANDQISFIAGGVEIARVEK